MAQNTTVSVPKDTWTQLTNANVSAITFQLVAGHSIYVKATTNTTAPTTTAGAILYQAGQGERNADMADLQPGLAGVRLWAYAPDLPASVMVSHA